MPNPIPEPMPARKAVPAAKKAAGAKKPARAKPARPEIRMGIHAVIAARARHEARKKESPTDEHGRPRPGHPPA